MDIEQVFFPAPLITPAKLMRCLAAPAARGMTLYIFTAENARVQIGDEVIFLSVERALGELGAALREIQALGSEIWAQKSSV